MALLNSVAAVVLVSVLFVGYVQNEAPLTPFGKQVQNLLPKDTYNKVFAVNKDNNDQLLKAVQKATDKFDEVTGAHTDKSLFNQLVDEGKRLGDNVTPSLLLHVHANAVGKTAKDYGKLNPENLKELAQKYVDELNKSAKSLKSLNVQATFPAITAANARFLKSLGLTSKNISNDFSTNLRNEIDKY